MHPNSTPPTPGDTWTDAEIALLRAAYPMESVRPLAARLGRSYNAVIVKARRLGLKSPRLRTIREGEWTPDDDAVLRARYPTESTIALAAQLGRSVPGVTTRAIRLCVAKEHRVCRYRVHSDAFATLTAETAYVLGFILADGCLHENSISIACTDRDIMERIGKVLDSDHPLIAFMARGSTRPAYRLQFFDRRIYADLLARGLTRRKSLTATMPVVPDALFFHFLRGFFDGDGSACIHNGGLTLSWGCASRVLLEQIAHRIAALSLLPERPVRLQSRRKQFWVLAYYGPQAVAIADLLYADAEDLCLPRKRAIIERYRHRSTKRGRPKRTP